MKNKGFTLIELLAVIVILAIIALIAFPVINKIVDKSRKGAAEASALNYIDTVEKYVVLHDLDSTKYPYELKNNTFNVADDTEISLLDIIVPKAKAEGTVPALNSFIKIKGDMPKDGTVTIDSKGKVTSADLYVNGHNVGCTNNSCIAEKGPRIRYIVSYDANGGTGSMSNSKNVIADNTFTAPTGAIFKEWNTKADGTGDVYTTSSELTSDLTLYAQWEYRAYSIGQAININGTDWYVIEDSPSSSSAVRLVSKYNLNKSANANTVVGSLFSTSESTYGIRFDGSTANYNSSELKGKLEGNFKQAIENALNITVDSINIFSRDDMIRLECVFGYEDRSDTLNCKSSKYRNTIILSAKSWTSISAYCGGCSRPGNFATYSYSGGYLYRHDIDGAYQGVRPIITISKQYIAE